MAKPLLFGADPEARKTQWFHDLGDEGFVIETKIDPKPIIEYNRFKYNGASDYGPSRWNPSSWGRHVARVPTNVVEQELMVKASDGSYQMRDDAYVKAWMNNQDKQVWRTMPGRI